MVVRLFIDNKKTDRQISVFSKNSLVSKRTGKVSPTVVPSVKKRRQNIFLRKRSLFMSLLLDRGREQSLITEGSSGFCIYPSSLSSLGGMRDTDRYVFPQEL